MKNKGIIKKYKLWIFPNIFLLLNLLFFILIFVYVFSDNDRMVHDCAKYYLISGLLLLSSCIVLTRIECADKKRINRIDIIKQNIFKEFGEF